MIRVGMPVPNESSERKLRTRRHEAQLTLIKMPALSRSAKPKLVVGRPALHEEAGKLNKMRNLYSQLERYLSFPHLTLSLPPPSPPHH